MTSIIVEIALDSGSSDLCDVGTVASFSYDSGAHTWSRDCKGDGGSTESCSASEERCGDTVTNGSEECDDGAT